MSVRRVKQKFLPTLMRRYDRAQLQNGGPICRTCLRVVDGEELVAGYARDEHGNTSQYDYAEVLVKCHGAEELVRFEMGSTDWTDEDLKKAMHRTRFFDPLGHADDGRLVVVVPR